jgi:hypothetical protein
MMSGNSLGQAWWNVGLKSDSLKRGLNEARQDIVRTGDAAERGLFGRMKAGAAGVLGPLKSVQGVIGAMGALYAGSQVVSFFADATQAASDLAETTSKANVVFGEQSGKVLELGETSARALGMSENAAISAAGTYGNLFRAMGLTETKSADMSVGLVRLAADLASFNNMDPTMVLDKLRAGLSGETEPLRALGVNLNQARIEAEAMATGLWNGEGAISAAAKAQATYSLILKDTSLAQGDYARTADGLANTQRSLGATIEDLTVKVGQALLPAMTAFANWMLDTGVPALEAFIGAFEMVGDAAEGMAKFMDGLTNVRDEVRATAEALGVSYMEARDLIKEAIEDGAANAEEASARIIDADRRAGAEHQAYVAQLGADWEAYQQQITPQAEEIARIPRQAIEAEWAATRAAAFETAVQHELGILDGQDRVRVAFEAMTRLQEEEQTRAQRISYLQGALGTQRLADGLASEKPGVRRTAEAIQAEIVAELASLGVDARGWGRNIGQSYADGMIDKVGAVKDAAGNVAAAAEGQLRIESEPPAWDSPLRGITRWGGNLVRTYADGMRNARAYLALAAQEAAATAGFGVRGGQLALAGTTGPLAASQGLTAAAGGGAGAVTVQFTYAPSLSTATPSEVEHMRRVVTGAVVEGLQRRQVLSPVVRGTY